MNAGEPPDETGESEVDERSTDPERGGDAAHEGETDSAEGAASTGEEAGDLDPAQEVEAAVEEVIGPGVLDDGEGDEGEDGGRGPAKAEAGEATDDGRDGPPRDGRGTADGDEIDEAAAVEAAEELVAGDTADELSEAENGERARDPTETGGAGDVEEPTETESGDGAREADDPEESPETGGVTEPTDDVPDDGESSPDDESQQAVPADVQKYDRFKKIDGGTYDRANEFLRDRTYITAREWAMARLCADFRTETGVEMTKIGENLPELVPFMTDTYTPQAVNQARAAFEEKVRKAGATFLYGAMCDFFTAEELDDVMYEATEVAKFLLEVEGVELSVEEELAAEDHISEVMRDVREHSAELRHDEVTCPECGHDIDAGE